MKKIVCPYCGAINLEKFVTYPHCAGCSALLPPPEVPPRLPFWRRPVRVWLWMIAVGATTIGLLLAAASFSSGGDEPARLSANSQTARRASPDGIVTCRLTLASQSDDNATVATLRDVWVRLPRDFERTFEILDVQPRPDSAAMVGQSKIYRYARWPIDERWRLRLRARRVGRHDLWISIGARDHYSVLFRTQIERPTVRRRSGRV